MRALFDVNMLLAILDPAHIHHKVARAWWHHHRGDGWASCPLTQNGFLRIVASQAHARPVPLADAQVILTAQVALPDHEFWPDDISPTNQRIFDHNHILGPKQLTDIYLLALAVKNSGRLVTFDRAIPVAAVRGAEAKHLTVL